MRTPTFLLLILSLLLISACSTDNPVDPISDQTSGHLMTDKSDFPVQRYLQDLVLAFELQEWRDYSFYVYPGMKDIAFCPENWVNKQNIRIRALPSTSPFIHPELFTIRVMDAPLATARSMFDPGVSIYEFDYDSNMDVKLEIHLPASGFSPPNTTPQNLCTYSVGTNANGLYYFKDLIQHPQNGVALEDSSGATIKIEGGLPETKEGVVDIEKPGPN